MIEKYSDNPKQFNIELIDVLNQALLDIALSGGVKKIKKGDFYAEYRSLEEIEQEIDRRKQENMILDGAFCTPFFRTRKVGGCR
jgi:hypothetical protein